MIATKLSQPTVKEMYHNLLGELIYNLFLTATFVDCLLGQWWASNLQLDYVLPKEHVASTLRNIFSRNHVDSFDPGMQLLQKTFPIASATYSQRVGLGWGGAGAGATLQICSALKHPMTFLIERGLVTSAKRPVYP